MIKKISGLIIALSLIIFLSIPAQAASVPKEMQAVQLTGRLQAILLFGMSAFDGQVLLGKALGADDAMFAEYEDLLKQLADLAGVGQPGRERITKYYQKVLARDGEITKEMNLFEQKMVQTGKADPAVSKRLFLLANRYRYAMNELVRHVAAKIDLAACTPEQQLQHAETLHFINLQRHLLLAVFQAYDANYPGASRPAHEFWFSLGSFDYSLQMYKAFIQVTGLAAKRAEMVTRLEKIKHGVVMKGEALFVERQKKGKPEAETVYALWQFNEEAQNLFKELLK